jgi:hypothetical protein
MHFNAYREEVIINLVICCLLAALSSDTYIMTAAAVLPRFETLYTWAVVILNGKNVPFYLPKRKVPADDATSAVQAQEET